jgi:hypothetical protein
VPIVEQELKSLMFYIFVYVLDNGIIYKEGLKIPKGQSESVNRRRPDNVMANVMAKRKRTK